MARWLIQRRLTQNSARLKRLRAELAQVDEQMLQFESDADDTAIRALVSETPGSSQEANEARTGETSRFFAYPSGRYDQYVIDVLRSADYWGAVLTEQGATLGLDDLFELRRVRVRGQDDLDAFIRKLNLDW